MRTKTEPPSRTIAAPGGSSAPIPKSTEIIAEARETLRTLPWLVTNGSRRELIRALVVSFSARPEITEHQRRRVLEQANRRRCLPPLEPDELTRIDAEHALVGVIGG
jgi:hypothetical protein